MKLKDILILALVMVAVLYATKWVGYVQFLMLPLGVMAMRQSYTTKAGQKVEAIYAYNRLTALHGQNEVTFFVPQSMRPEVNCTIRRKDWDRMETLLDELEARQF